MSNRASWRKVGRETRRVKSGDMPLEVYNFFLRERFEFEMGLLVDFAVGAGRLPSLREVYGLIGVVSPGRAIRLRREAFGLDASVSLRAGAPPQSYVPYPVPEKYLA